MLFRVPCCQRLLGRSPRNGQQHLRVPVKPPSPLERPPGAPGASIPAREVSWSFAFSASATAVGDMHGGQIEQRASALLCSPCCAHLLAKHAAWRCWWAVYLTRQCGATATTHASAKQLCSAPSRSFGAAALALVSESCKYGVIHKWHRNLRHHLDAVIPPFSVFSYDLRRNLRYFTVIYGPYCKTS